MHDFLLAFIPLFVAVDVVALVPIYLGIGMPLDEAARLRLVLEATLTAAAVGLGFLLIGDAVLYFLGVTVGDFQVAGGLLLLVLSIYELIHPELPLRQPGAHPGVVPLGIPMIVGPAVLTTLLTDDRVRIEARPHGCPDPRLHCDLDRLCAEPGDRLDRAALGIADR
jgi:multiple antibiotic resistance protein